ncbi:hypothetical protein AX17_003818 [Amanita inopinata Kibby_2008]|nr:hypothetical protein AX17_003818 [Amanita inopinata Kibby_2008]
MTLSVFIAAFVRRMKAMILDNIMDSPPPHYTPRTAMLTSLPSHILLQTVFTTFTTQENLEHQRKTLYWLSTSLRLVNRAFYIACMHVLRSTYLPSYLALVRSPYSSDPFPAASDQSSLAGTTAAAAAPSYTPFPVSTEMTAYPDPFHAIQRESVVLDLFIVVKVREDVWADDTELHLERHEFFKDLFDLNQPRSRLEDLVRIYGVRESLIAIGSPLPSNPPSVYSSPSPSTPTLVGPNAPAPRQSNRSFFSFKSFSPKSPSTPVAVTPPIRSITPIPFSLLSVSFTPRRVGLVLTTKQRKRTTLEVARGRDDKLETTARQLVAQLKVWLEDGGRL